jgi:hypothetical protein
MLSSSAPDHVAEPSSAKRASRLSLVAGLLILALVIAALIWWIVA